MYTFSIIDVIVITIVVIIVVFYLKTHFTEVVYVKSNVDGQQYLVRKLPDQQIAADLIADITKDLTLLVKHMIAKYPENNMSRLLYKNFNPRNISEGSPQSGYTSYSVNKGESIILCVRQKSDNKIVKKNVILYVAIHELAHLATESIGHDDIFWNNFKFMLQEAIDIGIYSHTDYALKPESYCGINITSSVI